MLPDRVSSPGPLTYESGALSIALRGPARTSNLQRVSDFGKQLTSFLVSRVSFSAHCKTELSSTPDMDIRVF